MRDRLKKKTLIYPLLLFFILVPYCRLVRTVPFYRLHDYPIILDLLGDFGDYLSGFLS